MLGSVSAAKVAQLTPGAAELELTAVPATVVKRAGSAPIGSNTSAAVVIKDDGTLPEEQLASALQKTAGCI